MWSSSLSLTRILIIRSVYLIYTESKKKTRIEYIQQNNDMQIKTLTIIIGSKFSMQKKKQKTQFRFVSPDKKKRFENYYLLYP